MKSLNWDKITALSFLPPPPSTPPSFPLLSPLLPLRKLKMTLLSLPITTSPSSLTLPPPPFLVIEFLLFLCNASFLPFFIFPCALIALYQIF